MSNMIKPYEGEESYIFASYAHDDKDVVFAIIEIMIQNGFRVWFDEGIDPGTEWDEEIAKKVDDSNYFVAFLSENYLKSENCKDELNYARDLGKKRLLVYLQDIELPKGMAMRLNRQQAIHFYKYDNTDEFYEKLFCSEGIECYREHKDQTGERAEKLNEEGESTKDPQMAYELFRQAAMQGSTNAQLNLGRWYMTGAYYPPDDEAAFGWFKMAADNGNAEAQFFVGLYYKMGLPSVAQDTNEALKYFQMAARQGHQLAREHIEGMQK